MMNKNIINLLLLIISGAIFFVVVIPAYNGLGFNNLKLNGFINEYYKNKSITDYLTTARELNGNVDKDVEAFNNISQDYLDKIIKAAPSKKDVARNINDIYNLGLKNKLSVSDFKFTKPSLSNNQAAQQSKKVYEISFNVKGDYFNFFNFVKEFENSLEIYNIKSLNITSSESDSIFNEVKYIITAETYEING